MHNIEPFYNWQHIYNSENDERSPFFDVEHSEFEFKNAVYNYLIHPQWDQFSSNTLYLKIIFAEYEKGYCIIELIGEWNDLINNDIMWFKREVIDVLITEGIEQFIIIGENVLNFHSSDDSYYEEWFNEIEEGWIAFVNFRDHVLEEFQNMNIDYYINFGGELNAIDWRTMNPFQLKKIIESVIKKRLN